VRHLWNAFNLTAAISGTFNFRQVAIWPGTAGATAQITILQGAATARVNGPLENAVQNPLASCADTAAVGATPGAQIDSLSVAKFCRFQRASLARFPFLPA